MLALVIIPAQIIAGAKTEPTKLWESYGQLQPVNQVFDMIRMGYPEPVDDKELIEGALKAMVASLDPHSQYLTSEDIAAEEERTETSTGELALLLRWPTELLKLRKRSKVPLPQAAIQADDLIVKIDGQELSNIPFDQAIIKLRTIDSKVIVSIQRGQQPIFDVELTRALIQSKIVDFKD